MLLIAFFFFCKHQLFVKNLFVKYSKLKIHFRASIVINSKYYMYKYNIIFFSFRKKIALVHFYFILQFSIWHIILFSEASYNRFITNFLNRIFFSCHYSFRNKGISFLEISLERKARLSNKIFEVTVNRIIMQIRYLRFRICKSDRRSRNTFRRQIYR